MSTNWSWEEEESPRGVTDQQLSNIRQSIQSKNQYTLAKSSQRRVLIIGRHCAGKSTVAGILKDPLYVPKKSLFLKSTAFLNYDVQGPLSEAFNISTFEMSGLKEDAGLDSYLMESFQHCVKNEFVDINVLLIVVSFENGVSKADLQFLQFIFEKLSLGGLRKVVCVTRAEKKSKSWKRAIVLNLMKNPYLKSLFTQQRFKVMFGGCVDEEIIAECNSTEELADVYGSVLQMRNELLFEIFKSNCSICLLDFPIFISESQRFKKLLEDQQDILSQLNQVNDGNFCTAKGRSKISKFVDNMVALKKQDVCLMNPEIRILYSSMLEQLKNITPKLPANIREQVTSSLL